MRKNYVTPLLAMTVIFIATQSFAGTVFWSDDLEAGNPMVFISLHDGVCHWWAQDEFVFNGNYAMWCGPDDATTLPGDDYGSYYNDSFGNTDPIDLSAYGTEDTLQFSFYEYYDTGDGGDNDNMFVEFSTDGTTWETLLERIGDNEQTSWEKTVIDISQYAGVYTLWYRFRFVSGAPVGEDDGWFIDNVSIDQTSETVELLPTEDFEGDWSSESPPPGWQIIDNGDESPPVWNNNDWHKYDTYGAQGNVARVYYSPTENQDEELITPSLDCTGVTNITLQFWHYYNAYFSGDAIVEVSTDGGGTWDEIAHFTDTDDEGVKTYDVSAFADNESDVMFRFHYIAFDEYYWQVDDVWVGSFGGVIENVYFEDFEDTLDLTFDCHDADHFWSYIDDSFPNNDHWDPVLSPSHANYCGDPASDYDDGEGLPATGKGAYVAEEHGYGTLYSAATIAFIGKEMNLPKQGDLIISWANRRLEFSGYYGLWASSDAGLNWEEVWWSPDDTWHGENEAGDWQIDKADISHYANIDEFVLAWVLYVDSSPNAYGYWYLDDLMLSDDIFPPIITADELPSDTPETTEQYVLITVTDDSGLAEDPMVYYRTGGSGAYMPISLAEVPVKTMGTQYEGYIPGQPHGTLVEYYFAAVDIHDNYATLPVGGTAPDKAPPPEVFSYWVLPQEGVDILIVNDDWDTDSADLMDAMAELGGIPYNLVDQDEVDLNLNWMGAYSTIIWGESGLISDDQSNALIQWLSAPTKDGGLRKLMIFGDDIGYYEDGTPLYSQYLKAMYVQDNIGWDFVQGMDNHRLGNSLYFEIDSPYPDEVDTNDPAAEYAFKYRELGPDKGAISSGGAGITYWNDQYASAYLSFPLGDILYWNMFVAVLDNTLNWFEEPWNHYYLDCSNVTLIGCGDTVVTGNTNNGVSDISLYPCAEKFVAGPEQLYSFTIAEPRHITAILDAATDLDLFMLYECDYQACFTSATEPGADTLDIPDLAAGTYYLVVDSDPFSAGDYNLTLLCDVPITPTATPTATETPTPIPPTDTPTPTLTPTPSPDTPTATPTNTQLPPTDTPTPTNTSVPPTDTPTSTPIPPTETPTSTPTPPSDTPTPTVEPTNTPTATPTPLPVLVFLAGYWDTYITSADGGIFNLFVYAGASDFSPAERVEFYLGGMPTGVDVPVLDPALGSFGMFGIPMEPGMDPAVILVEYMAFKGDMSSELCPYLNVGE